MTGLRGLRGLRGLSAGASIRVRADLPTTNAVELVIEDSAGETHSLTVVPDPPGGHFEVVAEQTALGRGAH